MILNSQARETTVGPVSYGTLHCHYISVDHLQHVAPPRDGCYACQVPGEQKRYGYGRASISSTLGHQVTLLIRYRDRHVHMFTTRRNT